MLLFRAHRNKVIDEVTGISTESEMILKQIWRLFFWPNSMLHRNCLAAHKQGADLLG
jgi:hypothetical protein